jgi:hypothetical protein
MSDADFSTLADALEQSDEEFTAALPAALDDVADDVAALLERDPELFESLTRRMSTLDGIADFASEDPETVEQFLSVMWTGMGIVAENVDAVRDAISGDYRVMWECEDSPITFHVETDADAGTISGGPGGLEDASVTFSGDTDTMFSMLNDPDFNAVQAFMQQEYSLDGPMGEAQQFGAMMETVSDSMEAAA